MNIKNLKLLILIVCIGLLHACKFDNHDNAVDETTAVDENLPAPIILTESQSKIVDGLIASQLDANAVLPDDFIEQQLAAHANVPKELVTELNLSGLWRGEISHEDDSGYVFSIPMSGAISADGIVNFKTDGNLSKGYYYTLKDLHRTYSIDDYEGSTSVQAVFVVLDEQNVVLAEYDFIGIDTRGSISGELTNGMNVNYIAEIDYVNNHPITSLNIEQYQPRYKNTTEYLKANELKIKKALSSHLAEGIDENLYIINSNGDFSFAVNGCIAIGKISNIGGVMQFAGKSTEECPVDFGLRGVIYINDDDTVVLQYFLGSFAYTLLGALNDV